MSGLNLQWRANGNPGTIGRPKSSHIPSQASVAAHPSNHRRAVTLLNSPGDDTNPVSCYFCTSCLLCQSLFNPRLYSPPPLSRLSLHFKDCGPGEDQRLPVTFSYTNIEYPSSTHLFETWSVRAWPHILKAEVDSAENCQDDINIRIENGCNAQSVLINFYSFQLIIFSSLANIYDFKKKKKNPLFIKCCLFNLFWHYWLSFFKHHLIISPAASMYPTPTHNEYQTLKLKVFINLIYQYIEIFINSLIS